MPTMIPPPPPPPPPPRAQFNGAAPPRPPPPPPRPIQASTAQSTSRPVTYPKPKSYEPYGEINTIQGSDSSGISHRRPGEASSQANSSAFTYGGSSYAVPPSSYGKPKVARALDQRSSATSPDESPSQQYNHNTSTLCLLIPSLASIFWWHESPVIIQIFLFVALVLYGLDLINARDALAVAIWISALILTMASGFATLLQVDDSDATGGAMVLFLVRLSVEGMLFCSMACWITLQFRWLNNEIPSVANGIERALHSLLPPVSSSILTYHIVRLLMDYWGVDRVATFLPLLFSLLMALGMLSLGCSPSSFKKDANTSNASSISSFGARAHSMILLMVPGLVHIFMFRRRIFSRHSSYDELFDLILVWAVPYLLHCGVLLLPEKCPYEMRNGPFPKRNEDTLRGALIPMLVSLLASVAVQQRYLIPLCHAVAYQFNGHDHPSTWIVSIYLTLATLSALFALWTWGRKSVVTGELLFGEYHEDVVQLTVSAGGLLLGKSFGIPWNLTPLPILAFLGLSVWITTRMLRYLAIFLFVVHAAGVVVFSYRFASIDMSIQLPLRGAEVSLVRFGMMEVMSSVLIGLVLGFAVRPSGGVGAELLKRVDVGGLLLIAYCLLLSLLEATLVRKPVPDEFVGKESDIGMMDGGFLYDHATALLTSALCIIVTSLCRNFKVISSKSSIVALSLATGKAIAVIIDANESDDGKARSDVKNEQIAQKMFYRSLLAAVLIIVMVAPRSILSPIHIKSTARYKRSLSDGTPLGAIPTGAVRNIVIYALVILPLALFAAIPMVLTPLIVALSSHYGGGAYYKMAPPFSEMAGCALACWGISCLSMLNHYLPDGGAETWKKASALTLVMGVGVAFSAPSVPEWISGDDGFGISNPYAAISSLGTHLSTQGRSRTGGWGILSASFATLLAATGPLELKERRHPSGRKDQFLLLRLMVFSILFGSGVSWFITIQSMSQESFPVLLLTALSCMVVSFFGTVTCVLAFFLELENFDEVDQMAKVWLGAFSVFGLITGSPAVMMPSLNMHTFGSGGWLSTFLAVSCCICFSLACVLRLRTTKNQATRGLGNLSCVVSFVFAIIILYGRYGVAGLDRAFDVTTIMGMPPSVLGTFLVSSMLLALEGEVSSERRSRVSRIAGTNAKPPKATMRLTLEHLTPSNRFAPSIVGILFTFFVAGFYAIFLRGFFFLGGGVAKSHLDVFSKVVGNDIIGKNAESLTLMAQKTLTHSQALIVSARMAGSGFWTSGSVVGPLIYLGGLIASVPSSFFFVTSMWTGQSFPKSQVVVALPLNAIPLLFCRAVPCIPAAALVGTVGGLLQLMNLQRSDRRSHMRI